MCVIYPDYMECLVLNHHYVQESQNQCQPMPMTISLNDAQCLLVLFGLFSVTFSRNSYNPFRWPWLDIGSRISCRVFVKIECYYIFHQEYVEWLKFILKHTFFLVLLYRGVKIFVVQNIKHCCANTISRAQLG